MNASNAMAMSDMMNMPASLAPTSIYLVVMSHNEVIESAWSTKAKAEARIASMKSPGMWDILELALDPS